jgi:HK97 gp10 family phage protein
MSMSDIASELRVYKYAPLNSVRGSGNDHGLGLRIPEMASMIQMFGGAVKELDKAIKRAANKSGRIIRKTARSKAPNRKQTIKIGGKTYRYYGFSGALKKSIDYSAIKIGKKTGFSASVRWAMAWSTYVGASRKAKQRVFVRWYRNRKKSSVIRNSLITVRPAWYSHFVEKGFVAKLWNTGRRVVVPARPFLRPALDSHSREIENITIFEMDVQLQKMADKQRSEGKG